MEESDFGLNREHHLQVALETMRRADPDLAEKIIWEYFEAGSSRWTGWDEQFLTFIEDHRKQGLLYGTIGDGWHFMFAPKDMKGFWVFKDEAMKGKGFLSRQSMDDLVNIARQKRLVDG